MPATLDGTNWEIFEAIATPHRREEVAAAAIRSAVEQALRCDEHVKPLAGLLKEAQSKAVRLLTSGPATASDRHRLHHRPASWPKVVDQGKEEFRDVAEAKVKLEDWTELTGQRIGTSR